MPPRIQPKRPHQVFLAEWREAQVPTVTQPDLGARFHPPVDKGTISRLEAAGRAGTIRTAAVQAYAEALGLPDYRVLYRHPNDPAPLDDVADDLGLDRESAEIAMRIAARKAS